MTLQLRSCDVAKTLYSHWDGFKSIEALQNYENTRIENFTSKSRKNFQTKNSDEAVLTSTHNLWF